MLSESAPPLLASCPCSASGPALPPLFLLSSSCSSSCSSSLPLACAVPLSAGPFPLRRSKYRPRPAGPGPAGRGLERLGGLPRAPDRGPPQSPGHVTGRVTWSVALMLILTRRAESARLERARRDPPGSAGGGAAMAAAIAAPGRLLGPGDYSLKSRNGQAQTVTPPWQVTIMILAAGADSDGYTSPPAAEAE